jgi:hypothetical protein
MPAVSSDHVSNQEYQVIDGNGDAADVVQFHCNIETDKGGIRCRILHAEPRQDQQQEHHGIDDVPKADKYGIEINGLFHVRYFFLK